MNLPDGGRAVKGGRRRGLAAAPWGDPGEVGPLDYMFPTCAVHPVPLELRRLVEGISSGPDDSREHRREQNRSLCYDTHVSLQPVFPDGALAELIFAGVRGGGRN